MTTLFAASCGEFNPQRLKRVKMIFERSSFRQYIEKVMREGEPWKPDIFLLEKEGNQILVKDYSRKSFFFRIFVGIIAIRREALIYQKLQGIHGIAKCFGIIDRYAIALEFIPSKNGDELREEDLDASFFDRMRDVIDAVHGRGVVLCDLRNVKNILMGPKRQPYLIDFATAFQKGGRFNIFKNMVYHIFHQDDILGIAKLKRTRAKHLLSEEERSSLEKGLFGEKKAQLIRKKGQIFLKKMFG
jgi:RIO-like serine/threonine protein kinase